MATPTLEYRNGSLWLLDQTKLPLETAFLECRDTATVAEAITSLRVRGAPAIGLTAAFGVALAAHTLATRGVTEREFRTSVAASAAELAATRPTAVNLFWALERMRSVLDVPGGEGVDALAGSLLAEAERMLTEDEAINRSMGKHGAEFIPDGANILTHCNAGALATGAYGTALGVILAAHEQGKRVHVWVDETRPLLQGARLTTWELKEAGIPHTLITDNMAGHFMQRGQIDLAMVGADRVVANGDAANKIGTYSVAVLARAHQLPFYFVAPTSTVDLSISDGGQIPIEERKSQEVTSFRGVQTAPDGTRVANPAFDVTPARLITAIVTENGIVHAPFSEGLRAAVAANHPTTPTQPAVS
jgi:methylthioribose-1-phosphate isomerase